MKDFISDVVVLLAPHVPLAVVISDIIDMFREGKEKTAQRDGKDCAQHLEHHDGHRGQVFRQVPTLAVPPMPKMMAPLPRSLADRRSLARRIDAVVRVGMSRDAGFSMEEVRDRFSDAPPQGDDDTG